MRITTEVFRERGGGYSCVSVSVNGHWCGSLRDVPQAIAEELAERIEASGTIELEEKPEGPEHLGPFTNDELLENQNAQRQSETVGSAKRVGNACSELPGAAEATGGANSGA